MLTRRRSGRPAVSEPLFLNSPLPIMRYLLLLLLVTGCASAQPESRPPTELTLALTRVTVIDATGAPPLPDRTVVVSAGRITAIGPSQTTPVPEGARVIDGSGRYLIPGLWDMHVHTMREGRAPRFFPLFIANGVTSVREMGTFPDSLEYWRHRAAEGMLAPRIAAAGHIVNGPPPEGATRPPPDQPTPAWVFSLAVSTPEEARAAVDTLAARNVDFVKTYSDLPREAYFALAEAARSRGIPFAGHVPTAVTAAEAADAGQRTMEHLHGTMEACVPDWDRRLQQLIALLRHPDAGSDSITAAARVANKQLFDSYSPELCAPLFARFRAKEVYHTPTLVQLRGLGRRQEQAAQRDPRMRFVPPSVRARWQPRAGTDALRLRAVHSAYVRLLGEMHRSGVPILAGTDASDEAYVFPGFSLHEELETFVRAGMPPMQALQAATRNAARAVGLEHTLGTIEVGKQADLVLLDANPLESIRNTQQIRAVILDGRLLDRAALDELLKQAEQLATSR